MQPSPLRVRGDAAGIGSGCLFGSARCVIRGGIAVLRAARVQSTGNAVNAAFDWGVNLGAGTTARWQLRANTSTAANTRFALGCTTGGYTSGSLGGLLGTLGPKSIVNGCIDTVP